MSDVDQYDNEEFENYDDDEFEADDWQAAETELQDDVFGNLDPQGNNKLTQPDQKLSKIHGYPSGPGSRSRLALAHSRMAQHR